MLLGCNPTEELVLVPWEGGVAAFIRAGEEPVGQPLPGSTKPCFSPRSRKLSSKLLRLFR